MRAPRAMGPLPYTRPRSALILLTYSKLAGTQKSLPCPRNDVS